MPRKASFRFGLKFITSTVWHYPNAIFPYRFGIGQIMHIMIAYRQIPQVRRDICCMGHLCILLYFSKLLIINHVQHSISVRLAHLPDFGKPEACSPLVFCIFRRISIMDYYVYVMAYTWKRHWFPCEKYVRMVTVYQQEARS